LLNGEECMHAKNFSIHAILVEKDKLQGESAHSVTGGFLTKKCVCSGSKEGSCGPLKTRAFICIERRSSKLPLGGHASLAGLPPMLLRSFDWPDPQDNGRRLVGACGIIEVPVVRLGATRSDVCTCQCRRRSRVRLEGAHYGQACGLAFREWLGERRALLCRRRRAS
jgi:hypothetical protein